MGSLPKVAVGGHALEGNSQGEWGRTQEGTAVFLKVPEWSIGWWSVPCLTSDFLV